MEKSDAGWWWRLKPVPAQHLIEVAGEDDSEELRAQIADEQQQRDANRPPLGALVVDVDVGDREVGARRVRRPAELASNNHALDSPRRVPGRADDVDGRTREVARESIVVEEHGAMVLGDHVEVLRQGTVSDKAEPSCTQITCQGPFRCEASKLGSEPRAGPGFHDKICNLSVGRRLDWSVLKAGRGDRQGKQSRNSAVGSQSCKR